MENICKCGHIARAHYSGMGTGCGHKGCDCKLSGLDVLEARLEAADALFEAAKEINNSLPFGEIELSAESIGQTNARILLDVKRKLIFAIIRYEAAKDEQ